MAGSGLTYSGIDGFREMWLDWLEPWAGYRTQVDEMFEIETASWSWFAITAAARRPMSTSS